MPYKDKEKKRENWRKWYHSNPEYRIRCKEKNIKRKKIISEFIKNAKNLPCKDCKVKYPHYVMEFDHVRGTKIANVCSAPVKSWSLKKLKEEIEKCEVVCSNCHQARTYFRRKNITHL